MWFKKRLQKNINMKVYERQCMIIATLFFTLFLFTAWPRFRNDAMSIPWYLYLILAFAFLIPFLKKAFKK